MKKIYLFAVIFALITGFATFFFINGLKHNSNITGVEEADVVIALQDIEPDTVVTPEMFSVVRLPVSAITYGTIVNPDDVIGYVATVKIFAGEQVLSSKLALIDKNKDKDVLEYDGQYRLSYHLENGNYAYTLSIPAAEDAVAHFIRRGDYVNVYFIDAPDMPLLRNVKVLEIGKYNDYISNRQEKDTLEYEFLTLSLTEEQIETVLPYEGQNFTVTLVSYSEGAAIITLPDGTEENGFGETEKGPRLEEPVTNTGTGELQPTETTAA